MFPIYYWTCFGMAIATLVVGISYWLIEFWLVKRRAAQSGGSFYFITNAPQPLPLLFLEKFPKMNIYRQFLLFCMLPAIVLLIPKLIMPQQVQDSLKIDGKLFYCALMGGKSAGNWIAFFPNGQMAELRHFADGCANGLGLVMDDHGNLVSQGYYLMGKKHSRWLYFGAGGRKLAEENYVDGKLQGWEISYYEHGSIQEKAHYSNDLRQGTTLWLDEKGNAMAEYTYSADRFHGVQPTWHPNGVLRSESFFENNLQHGMHREFYADGIPRIEGEYFLGCKKGIWTKWNADGSIRNRELLPE